MFKRDMEPETETDTKRSSGLPESLNQLANIAKQYGISVENIENDAKNIYRTLSKQIHPDLYPEPNVKIKKEEEMKELNAIWDKVPNQYKTANTWYDNYVYSEVVKTIIINSIKKDIK